MAREFAVEFYHSKAWKKARADYARSKGRLCERCLKAGRYTPGEIVHHKVQLTPENITDPEVALSWENLELLCREHHAEVHSGHEIRYTVDEMGRVTAL